MLSKRLTSQQASLQGVQVLLTDLLLSLHIVRNSLALLSVLLE
jgi:hypothetical protein